MQTMRSECGRNSGKHYVIKPNGVLCSLLLCITETGPHKPLVTGLNPVAASFLAYTSCQIPQLKLLLGEIQFEGAS